MVKMKGIWLFQDGFKTMVKAENWINVFKKYKDKNQCKNKVKVVKSEDRTPGFSLVFDHTVGITIFEEQMFILYEF